MYRVFTRRWWKDDPKGSGRLVPDPHARKYTLKVVRTIEEARQICKEWNDSHDPGRYSRKAEFMDIGST